MKKGSSILIFALALMVWSCSHKMSPAATTAGNANTTPDAAALGQTTYNAKCGRCHELKTTTDYTADRWVGIMDAMAPKAQLTDAEKGNVLTYVKANAKK